jgi:hypothetical protein
MTDITAALPTSADGLFATVKALFARSLRSPARAGSVTVLALDPRQQRDAGLPSDDHAERTMARMLRCGL